MNTPITWRVSNDHHDIRTNVKATSAAEARAKAAETDKRFNHRDTVADKSWTNEGIYEAFTYTRKHIPSGKEETLAFQAAHHWILGPEGKFEPEKGKKKAAEALVKKWNAQMPDSYKYTLNEQNMEYRPMTTKTILESIISKDFGVANAALKESMAGLVLVKIDEMSRESIDEASGINGEYHPSNPKIHLYHDGRYVASTNFAKTVKYAVERAKQKYPDMTGKWTGAKAKD